MPQVKCPDCFRMITVSQDDLTKIIECALCDGRFGPLVQVADAPAAPPPTPPKHVEPTLIVAEMADDAHLRPTRLKPEPPPPKPSGGLLPTILGLEAALICTLAIAVTVVALFKFGAFDRPAEPPAPAATAQP